MYCFCFLGNQQTLGHKMKTIFLGIDLVVVENDAFDAVIITLLHRD